MRIPRLVPLLLAVAACSGQSPPQPWERADRTPPSVTDTSYCRQEARRQADTLYPGQAPNDAVGRPRTTDDRNFAAEVGFYNQCMTRLGYMRASAPAR
jgi:hypothetical protein